MTENNKGQKSNIRLRNTMLSDTERPPKKKKIECSDFLVVLGYNGCLPFGNHGRQRSKYRLLEPSLKRNRFQLENRNLCASLSSKSIAEAFSHTDLSTIPKAVSESDLKLHNQKQIDMKFGEVMKHHLLRDKENRLLELNSSSSQYIYQIGRSSGETIDFVVRDKATIEWEMRNQKLVHQTRSCFPITKQCMDVISNEDDSPVIVGVHCQNENTEFPESNDTTFLEDDSFDSAILLNSSTTESLSGSDNESSRYHGESEFLNFDNEKPKSCISRYAFRIVVDQQSGNSFIFAGGFADSSFRIALGKKNSYKFDGNQPSKNAKENNIFTSNGVLLWKPSDGFMEEDRINRLHEKRNESSFWAEVSVNGKSYYRAKYESRPQREINHEKKMIEKKNNMLIDGSLIDICGATLLYRTKRSLVHGPSIEDLFHMIDKWNGENYVCSVSFIQLFLRFELAADDLFGSSDTILSSLSPLSLESFKKTPFVFVQCGHVFGPYKWNKEPTVHEENKCPICNRDGQVFKLSMGMEPLFWVDNSEPTHAFKNCGHMASENTIRYWLSVGIPQRRIEFVAQCPFCGTEVTDETGYVKLLYPCNVDAIS